MCGELWREQGLRQRTADTKGWCVLLADEACMHKQVEGDEEGEGMEVDGGSDGATPEQEEQADAQGQLPDDPLADRRPDVKCGFVKGQWTREEDDKVGVVVW